MPDALGQLAVAHMARKKRRYPADRTILLPRQKDIKQFQQFHNLPLSGVIDKATRRKMRKTNTHQATGALGYGGPH